MVAVRLLFEYMIFVIARQLLSLHHLLDLLKILVGINAVIERT